MILQTRRPGRRLPTRDAPGFQFVLLLLLSIPFVSAAAAVGQGSLTLDRSNGSYAGTVWLVATPSEGEATDRFVGVGIARLPEGPLEHSFVLRTGSDGEAPAAEGVDDLVGAGRTVVVVQVGPQAHDEVRHLIARWQTGEQEGTEPGLRIENLLDRVVRVLDLKAPYRSALSGSDPVAYLRDLARINGAG